LERKYRRINVLIEENQYEQVQKANLNLSGLIRDLIDDHFSDKKIQIRISKEGREFYDQAISNFGVSDEELEATFLQALDQTLAEKTAHLEALRKTIKRKLK